MTMNVTAVYLPFSSQFKGPMYSITNCIIAPDKHMYSYIFNPFN